MLGERSELVKCREKFHLAIEAAGICVFEVDLKQRTYKLFENAEAIYGKSGDAILEEIRLFSGLNNKDYFEKISDYFTHKDDHASLRTAFERALAGTRTSYYARMKTGQTFVWCKVDLLPNVEYGEPISIIGVISNVDKIIRQRDEYKKKSECDSLTGLLNKKHTELSISETLIKDMNKRHALILLDLDDFKSVNDNYGHIEGDMVLRQTSEHLQNLFRRTDIVGRWGGDEFVVLMIDIPDEDILRLKIEKLLEPKAGAHYVTKSIGVALFPQHGREFEEIFSKADTALYMAKKNKNRYEIYRETTDNQDIGKAI
ncbi:MAG: GGDEF domain-containing protein [Oscillospiraceae bacterium]